MFFTVDMAYRLDTLPLFVIQNPSPVPDLCFSEKSRMKSSPCTSASSPSP